MAEIFVAFVLLVLLNLGAAVYQIRELQKVHVLVNSRLSLALDETETLKKIVSRQQTALDEA